MNTRTATRTTRTSSTARTATDNARSDNGRTSSNTSSRNTRSSSTRSSNRRRTAMAAIASVAVGGALLLAAPVASAFGANDEIGVGQPTCPGNVVTLMGPATGVGVEAPAGWLIAGYCAIAEGEQADNVAVDPPVPSLVFSHSSGKDTTKYSLVLVPAPFDPDGQLPGDFTNPEPGDDPQPGDNPGDLTNPEPDDDPQPGDNPGDLTNPEPDDDPQPGDNPGDLTNPEPDDDPQPGDNPEPVTPQDDDPQIVDVAPDVDGSSPAADSSDNVAGQPVIEQLPVTGFGTALIAALASALLGAGVATIRIARRPH